MDRAAPCATASRARRPRAGTAARSRALRPRLRAAVAARLVGEPGPSRTGQACALPARGARAGAACAPPSSSASRRGVVLPAAAGSGGRRSRAKRLVLALVASPSGAAPGAQRTRCRRRAIFGLGTCLVAAAIVLLAMAAFRTPRADRADRDAHAGDGAPALGGPRHRCRLRGDMAAQSRDHGRARHRQTRPELAVDVQRRLRRPRRAHAAGRLPPDLRQAAALSDGGRAAGVRDDGARRTAS